MNVLFLDLDGVLNTKYKISKEDGEPTFEREPVNLLNGLNDYVPYKIVITSTWRMRHGVERLNQLMQARGLEPEVIDVIRVPKFDPVTFIAEDVRSRPDDIRAWLDEHPEAERYVVLDDVEATTREFGKLGIRVEPHVGVNRYAFQQLWDRFLMQAKRDGSF